MTPRLLEGGLDLITGLIVISVAAALAGLTWRLLGEPGGGTRSAVAVAPAPAPPAPVDLTPVFQFAPFGAPVDPLTPGAAGLGLTLRGIMRAVPSSASSALISIGSGPVQAIGAGQTIAGGALVDEIAIDHVVLRVNGRRQILGFPDKRAGGPASAGAAASGIAAIRAAIPASVSGLAPTPPVQPAADAGAINLYRDRVAAGPRSFADTLGAVATPQGYRIGPSPSPEMRAAGLQTGDLVQKINGSAVGNSDSDRQVFDQAVLSGRARLEVQRDGRQIVMSFPLR